jgi:hypothetical protein
MVYCLLAISTQKGWKKMEAAGFYIIEKTYKDKYIVLFEE